jgi:probable DNA metabolism protein
MYQQRLDAEYIFIDTDEEKAQRVFTALTNAAPQAAENAFYAYSSPLDSRYMDILKYISHAFSKKSAADRYLQLDYVRNVLQMRSYAGMETHKLHGFVRFAQTRSGVLYSEIAPVNDVLYFVSLHFTERLISEAWVIHDIKRKKAAIYDTKQLVLVETGDSANIELAPGEEQFQDLFIGFLESVAIKDRVNPKLQRQLLPNRYRPYMTEFSRRTYTR